MNSYFFDSSALVKRYLTETGSDWVYSNTDLKTGHTVTVVEITVVEIAAALAARHRAPKGISRRERDAAVNLLANHFETEYQLVPVNQLILDKAVALTQTHKLRGYDAVQLAAALAANQAFLRAGLATLTFVAADRDLLAAAQQEGLEIKNPNDHLA
jgi:uncharacterized protein